ncbi:hypothetical protein NDU88_008144 [Pleurodeles waltl]|uniref:Lamina-associated polypeptide 2 alpha C-terminal domain-containing protein n=1 Tax=Pleurodeles waltl TaxID=8319 RepID=A0AAV7RRG9_PLEWA|nr:hypothetical protein NDU88_008144 [Pleurodeles waltl]
MHSRFRNSIPVESFVASLVGHIPLAEEAVIRDPVDKKVDGFLRKMYPGAHLAFHAGIYGTYVAQSLISDIKTVNRALDESSDCSGILELVEKQVEFLSDVFFDEVRASALTEGACVAALQNLVLRDWKTDAVQNASLLKLSF